MYPTLEGLESDAKMDAVAAASVIAGLDPAIHLLGENFFAKKMDPRVKPAGDGAKTWMPGTRPGMTEDRDVF